MKIQNLAIIFIIIILPISLVIATYTQHQIQTINTQTLYDSKLTSATYDAIRAFQINSTSSATSELTNSKTRDLEASISAFRNSIKSTFSLAGYSEDAIDQYIPALVYTLYDGLYIYSPYENRVNQEGEILDTGDSQYGLKPYISYSCRYVHTIGNIDVVITYALDNHISVRGIVNGEYVNKEGYLVDNIEYDGNKVKYNGIEIEEEQVYQYLPMKEGDNNVYKYIKLNGTTYYADTANERIIARLNDTTLTIQCSKAKNGQEEYEKWLKIIDNNSLAKDYYIDAYNFTKWFKESGLQELTYGDARDSIINDNGETIEDQQLWTNDNQNKKIFKFNTSNSNYNDNIENESSNFNEHRLYIIRHKIEVNMAIAIANYNAYLGVRDTFQMPKIEEGEWYSITHNISLISFLQGLQIGGRQYNGYSLVTNSESKEVVLENNIYILGADGDGNEQYYKIGDKGIRDGVVIISAGEYSNDHTAKSAGRINLDFERGMLVNSDKTKTYYYYPIKNNDASYNSIVMQNEVNTYDDIYKYVNEADYNLKIAFYTALGRERASTYKKWADYVDTNNLKLGYTITYKKSDGGIYDTQNVNAGENHKVKDGITKPGYTFNGWKDEYTGNVYLPGGIIQNINNDITLSPLFDKRGNILKNTSGENLRTSGFLGNTQIQRQDIENVTFVNGFDGINETAWDVSENGDDSIKAWYKISNSKGALKVYIGSENEIFANADSSCLFAWIGFGDKCTATETITNISLLNTSDATNMKMMFAELGYKSMTKLDLGDNFDTSNVTNMQQMFADTGPYTLKTFNIGNKFNTSKVTNMSAMFWHFGMGALQELNLGNNFDTSNVTDMSEMFNSAGHAIKSLSLGEKFNTSKVTDMHNMFNATGYDAMTSLNLGDKFDTSNVTNMNSMFSQTGYKLLKVLDLGDKFDTSKVKNMEYMFCNTGWGNLTKLDLGDKFATSNVTSMKYMFLGAGYKTLKTLNLGDKFNTSKVTNMENMFNSIGVNTLTSLDLGNKFDTRKVTNMEGMFSWTGNGSMTSLNLGPAFTQIARANTNMFDNVGKWGSLVVKAPTAIYENSNTFKLGRYSTIKITLYSGFILRWY